MHRNVYRGKLFGFYAVDFRIGDVCKCNVVAAYERKSPVVILDVKRFTLSLGKLVNKAKQTFVGAPTRFYVAFVVKIPAHRLN